MDQLEEIKQKVDIVSLIGEYLQLKKAGRNFKALCPFHSEKTPSFIISPERQIWKCFGCSAGGDIFGFLMRMEGMEFGEALRSLAKRAGVKLESRQIGPEAQKKQLYYEINNLAAEFYHYLLTKHSLGKKALDYILGRRITSKSLSLFKIGFSPNLYEGLQKFLIAKKGYQPQDLEIIGLIGHRPRGGFYDRFRGRLMFSLQDHRGNVCGFAGRLIPGVTVGQDDTGKYINTQETVLYHKSDLLYALWLTRGKIQLKDSVVVVEGELDAISSYQAGVENVVAIKGSALTESQLRLLGRYTHNLIMALDSDLAGDQAARRGIELADSMGFSLKVVDIVGGKDPDDVAQKDPALWQKLVSEAIPVYDYLINSAFKRFDSQTGEGKRKIGQELVPLLAKMTDAIVRSYYLGLVASRLGVGEKAVAEEVNKFLSTKGRSEIKTIIPPRPSVQKKSRRFALEEYLLALSLQTGEWSFVTQKEVVGLIQTPSFLNLIQIIVNHLGNGLKINSKILAPSIPAELSEIFNGFYLYDLKIKIDDENLVKKELEKGLKLLQKYSLNEKIQSLSQSSRKLQAEGNKEEGLDTLNQELSQLSRQLKKLEN